MTALKIDTKVQTVLHIQLALLDKYVDLYLKPRQVYKLRKVIKTYDSLKHVHSILSQANSKVIDRIGVNSPKALQVFNQTNTAYTDMLRYQLRIIDLHAIGVPDLFLKTLSIKSGVPSDKTVLSKWQTIVDSIIQIYDHDHG